MIIFHINMHVDVCVFMYITLRDIGVICLLVMYASIIEVQNCQIKEIHSSIVWCSEQEKGEIDCLGFEFILVV